MVLLFLFFLSLSFCFARFAFEPYRYTHTQTKNQPCTFLTSWKFKHRLILCHIYVFSQQYRFKTSAHGHTVSMPKCRSFFFFCRIRSTTGMYVTTSFNFLLSFCLWSWSVQRATTQNPIIPHINRSKIAGMHLSCMCTIFYTQNCQNSPIDKAKDTTLSFEYFLCLLHFVASLFIIFLDGSYAW